MSFLYIFFPHFLAFSTLWLLMLLPVIAFSWHFPGFVCVCVYSFSFTIFPRCYALHTSGRHLGLLMFLLLILSQYFRFSMRRSKAQVKYMPMWHFEFGKRPLFAIFYGFMCRNLQNGTLDLFSHPHRSVLKDKCRLLRSKSHHLPCSVVVCFHLPAM